MCLRPVVPAGSVRTQSPAEIMTGAMLAGASRELARPVVAKCALDSKLCWT